MPRACPVVLHAGCYARASERKSRTEHDWVRPLCFSGFISSRNFTSSIRSGGVHELTFSGQFVPRTRQESAMRRLFALVFLFVIGCGSASKPDTDAAREFVRSFYSSPAITLDITLDE